MYKKGPVTLTEILDRVLVGTALTPTRVQIVIDQASTRGGIEPAALQELLHHFSAGPTYTGDDLHLGHYIVRHVDPRFAKRP